MLFDASFNSVSPLYVFVISPFFAAVIDVIAIGLIVTAEPSPLSLPFLWFATIWLPLCPVTDNVCPCAKVPPFAVSFHDSVNGILSALIFTLPNAHETTSLTTVAVNTSDVLSV